MNRSQMMPATRNAGRPAPGRGLSNREATALCRRLAAAALAVLLVVQAAPAAALTVREVGKVVEVVEKLRPHFGPLAYDEGLADDWFARDAEGRGVIAAAGFTAASWRAAFDATICGYLAGVPESSVEAIFAELRARLARSPRLTAVQRASIEEFVQEERARLERLRLAGRPDVEAVRPFADRLQRLLPGPEGSAR